MFNLICDTLPSITAQAGVSQQQGLPASNSQIATVNDTESGAAGVTVTVTSANPSNGVTLLNIINTNGAITADIVATCKATNASFALQASDGFATTTATLSVAVTTNTAPSLSYGNATMNSPTVATDNGAITGYAVQSVGTYTGMISVNASSVVSLSNAAPVGTQTILSASPTIAMLRPMPLSR